MNQYFGSNPQNETEKSFKIYKKRRDITWVNWDQHSAYSATRDAHTQGQGETNQ